jgi:hypothetical protein
MCNKLCSIVHPHHAEAWGGDCREELLRYDRGQADLADLVNAADDFAAIIPATDEEWQRRLDEIAPKVEVTA